MNIAKIFITIYKPSTTTDISLILSMSKLICHKHAQRDIASEIEACKCDVFSVLTFYINESDRYVTSTCFWIYLLSFKTFHLF